LSFHVVFAFCDSLAFPFSKDGNLLFIWYSGGCTRNKFLIKIVVFFLNHLQPIARFQGQASDIELARKEVKNVKAELVCLIIPYITFFRPFMFHAWSLLYILKFLLSGLISLFYERVWRMIRRSLLLCFMIIKTY
jgi:hypothetical protein